MTRRLLILAICAVAVHVAVARAGSLQGRPAAWFGASALLATLAWWAWREVHRAGRPALRWALVAAALFRVIATFGEPGMSDDVFRYVWDGRVLAAGLHPYSAAPDDPGLAALRDEEVWPRINHPSVRTIYPPLAQYGFAALAAVGFGPRGFRWSFAVCDLAIVVALLHAARRQRFEADRVVLYAWHPLAILEGPGNGHVEPVGVLLVVLAVVWGREGCGWRAGAALGAAVQIKLFPVVFAPAVVRRSGFRAALAAAVVAAALALPLARFGPSFAPGTLEYAARWERNASVFAGFDAAYGALDTGHRLAPAVGTAKRVLGGPDRAWEAVYRACWPGALSRGTVALLAVLWLAWVVRRPSGDAFRDALRISAGVLVLSPTVHPWYLLWVAPFAAATASIPALAWTALAPLAYIGEAEVAWWARVVEYGVPVALAGILARRSATMRS